LNFLYSGGSKNLVNSLLISASFYLFFITIKDFFAKASFNYSQKLSHFGFSLLVLSILLNSIFSSEVITNLRVGENIVFKNEIIYFDSTEKKKQC
jgi:cytochrome c-type biogenesis protein CcmF